MPKDSDAFRTITEVAEELDVPQHVLRFWEGKFPQISPMKRGGGRRYYRPDEVELLKAIRALLYHDGYTIRGVQRLLKERGVRSVALTVFDQSVQVQADATLVDEHEPRSQDDAALLAILADADPVPHTRASAAPPMGMSGLKRSLVEVARELQACRSILAAAKSSVTPSK